MGVLVKGRFTPGGAEIEVLPFVLRFQGGSLFVYHHAADWVFLHGANFLSVHLELPEGRPWIFAVFQDAPWPESG